MLSSHRCTGVTRLGAFLETHALIHRRFRIDITRNQNVVADERPWLRSFRRKGYTSRPVLVLVLEGRSWIEYDGRPLLVDPGSTVFLPCKLGMVVRSEGARFLGLAVEWDPGTLGGVGPASATVGRLPATDLHVLRAVVDALTAGPRDSAEAREIFSSMVGALQRGGAPLRVPGSEMLSDAQGPRVWQGVRTALDRSLSDLCARPMIVDLQDALGASPRHLQRLIASFHAQYGFDAGGWRDALRRRRMLVGTALMTAPGASTDVVSRALGYGSTTAFCHALLRPLGPLREPLRPTAHASGFVLRAASLGEHGFGLEQASRELDFRA
jgi:hypothetical protein